MKAVMMNELESAIVEWVTKNDKHGKFALSETFIGKGYPFDDVEAAINRLLESGTLKLVGGWVTFEWPEEDTMDKDGFSQKLLNYISDDTRNLAVPDYIKAVMEPKDKNPAVHSPSHYTRGGIETIDFIEAKGLNFHLGNVVKYVSRAGFKQDAKIQDLEKALWYLNREIARVKSQEV